MIGHADSASAARAVVYLEGVLVLGRRAVVIAWRDTGGLGAGRGWRALEAGTEARPPRARLTLAAPDRASTLHLLMLAPPSSGKLLLESIDGDATLPVELASSPPLALGDLARGLSAPDRRRLLGWVLGVCPTLFRLTAEPELGFLVRDLLQAVLPPSALPAARRRCHVPDGWTMVETVIGEGFEDARLDGFVLAGHGGVRRAFVAPIPADPSAAGRHPLLAVFEDPRPAEVATLVLTGAAGITCRRIEAAGTGLPAAADWVAATAENGRADVREAALNALALLADRPGTKTDHNGLLREVLRMAPCPPPQLPGRVRATLAAVAEAQGRIVIVGALTDPDRLVAGLLLRRLGAPTLKVDRAELLIGPQGDRAGARSFVAVAAAPRAGDARLPWRGDLVLRSGRKLPIGEAPLPESGDDTLERLLDAAAPMADLPSAWPLLEPAARAAAAARLTDRQAGSIRRLGSPLLRPRAGLVVPFRRADEAVRLVAMLEAEPEGGSVELVLVGLEPDPSVEIEAAALAARHARAVRLVLPSMPVSWSDVPLLGADATEAPVVLVVGAGIVPRVRGWLGVLLGELGAPADNEPVVALAGLPMAGQPELGPLPSLAVFAGVRRSALLAAGGLAGDWLDAGHRDADLALRLLAVGFRVRMLPGPSCIRIGSDTPSRTAGAARLAAALDASRLARAAASCRQRRAAQHSAATERLALAR